MISIIVPAYNAERYIGRTLRSALNQTFRDIEVIVINDGSTDNTRLIVEKIALKDNRVRVFNTVNRGVAMARNLGIEKAQGSYVAFLDADDLWHPIKIERQFTALNAHAPDSTWAGVYAFYRQIDEEDYVIRDGLVTIDCRGYVLARNLVLKFIGNGSSLMVRREAALAVGGFDPSYASAGLGGCEDLDFEYKIAARYRIEAVRLFLVGYRVREGNMSSHKVRMAKSMLAIIEQHIKLNPLISPRIRRWARGDSYRYAFGQLRSARKFRPAMHAYYMVFVTDPMLSIYPILYPILRKLGRVVGIALPSTPKRQKFLCMHPEAGLDTPISARLWMRQKQLLTQDRALEARMFFAWTTSSGRNPRTRGP